MKISIVVPIYNEESTLREIINRIIEAPKLNLDFEIILINDNSNDNTAKIISEVTHNNDKIKAITHRRNKGKGAAIKSGLNKVNGDIILIQDADLEYNPKEYPKLLSPIVNEGADVVYGSRFRSDKETRVLYFWHRIANGLLTLFSNMFTNLNLTDMETGYKVFKREALNKISLTEDRFGMEPEITAKIAKIPNIKIYEVGISYFGRTYEEGKKIGLKDAFRAFFVIIKYGFFK